MIKTIKKIFSKEKEEVTVDPPGRTFKRVLTGDYFSCEKENADPSFIEKSKQDKIDQINTLALEPKFVRFNYKKESSGELDIQDALSAHVVFQKEIFAQKWNMIHITEISFTIRASNFEEFEKMSTFSLKEDFKDLTEIQYRGEERRQAQRA